MKTAEKTLRKKICRALRRYGALPVENPCVPGTPDVSCSLAWLELKEADMPKRATTPVRVPHYTEDQRRVHRFIEDGGGLVFVLVQVGRNLVMLTATVARDILNHVPFSELEANAVHSWKKLPTDTELRSALLSASASSSSAGATAGHPSKPQPRTGSPLRHTFPGRRGEEVIRPLPSDS